MVLEEKEARRLVNDEVLEGTVLKRYKFIINKYGEFIETTNA